MKLKKTVTQATFCCALASAAVCAQAAAVNNGDVLTITTGVQTTDSNGNPVDVISGSYFGIDTNGNSSVDGTEKTGLSQGTAGLVIGTTTAVGAYHLGAPVAGDTNAIDAPWLLSGSTGSHYLTAAVTGSTTSGLDLSGWTQAWSVNGAIAMGSGAWQPLNCAALGCSGHSFTDGNARFQWDGIYGHAYTLDYTATIAPGDPSGLGGFRYFWHLTGTVEAVPLPAAVWLFGSGLAGLLGLARRGKVAA